METESVNRENLVKGWLLRTGPKQLNPFTGEDRE